MTGNEIIKALECLAYHKQCPESEVCQYYMDNGNMCDNISLAKDVLDLINHYKAEIERLERHTEMYHEVRAEAVKEFADELKEKAHRCDLSTDEHEYYSVGVFEIDKLVEEKVGETK